MSDFETVQEYETVNLLRDGAAAIVEMNRPEVLNAWNGQIATDLVDALNACAGDDVRAVLVTGAGRGFSAGADLGSMSQGGLPTRASGRPDLERLLHARYHPIMRAVRGLDKPVLAGVDGTAAGIGMSFALACDLVTVSERAKLNHAFTKIGLGPDGGASIFLVARLGWTRASEIMLEGRVVEAEEALRIGLVNRVRPTEGFRSALEEQVRALAAGPTASHAATKRVLNALVLRSLEEVLSLEAREQGLLGDSTDFAGAVSAFMKKEQPTYIGR
ncbi:enoyl-CoA hydratase/isomerase family protein [Patulibacter sp.]|uniref:enoyl-CoA hydratase/isomerase family protein n=1 Tax=Patulibacter sp. TaxID=1912859 RepID=UPI00271A9879|nr:enoyl-CoA hydratase-related protein [Patulibacter sp.]MDO9409145.1 enoyl-CoA hydratase-related protein [Patulibacter sp.]